MTLAFRRFHSSRSGDLAPGASACFRWHSQHRPRRTVGLLHQRGCAQGVADRLAVVLQHRWELGADRLAITRLDRLNECLKKRRHVAAFQLLRLLAKLRDDVRSRGSVSFLARARDPVRLAGQAREVRIRRCSIPASVPPVITTATGSVRHINARYMLLPKIKDTPSNV